MAILDTFPMAHVPGRALTPQPALLIGLVGRAGAGKSTVARMLEDEFSFVELAFAEPLKAMLSALYHEANIGAEWLYDRALKELPTALGVSSRRLAQTLGTEWGRAIAPDFWVRIAERRIAEPHLEGQSIVFSDVRYANEAEMIHARGGRLWRVQRNVPTLGGAAGAHSSEAEADTLQVDETIINDSSLATLGDQVARLIEQLRAEAQS